MEQRQSIGGFSIIFRDGQEYAGGRWLAAGTLSCEALNISKEDIAGMEELARSGAGGLYGRLTALDCVALTANELPQSQAAGVLDDIICFRIYIKHFINKYLTGPGESACDPFDAYSRFSSKLDGLIGQLRREDALRRTVLPREFTPKIKIVCVDGRICEQYTFPTLCQLLVFDQLRALQYDKAAKKCRNCGGFFTPDRRNAGYCDRPAPGDPGHTCREVGARRVFVRRHEGSQAYKLCASACGRIYTRKSRGSITAEEAAGLLSQCNALRDRAVAGDITNEQLAIMLNDLTDPKKKG